MRLEDIDSLLERVAEYSVAADNCRFGAVVQMRDVGMSWRDVGRRLGVSQQAAHERFADRVAAYELEIRRESAGAG